MAWTARSNEEEREYFDSPSILDSKVTKLAELIKSSKYMTCFTGAGISTSAGIPDFRSGLNTVLDTGAGAWAQEAAIQNGIDITPNRELKTVSMLNALPTTTHMTLVELNNLGILKYLISQNCDGLHRRSGYNPQYLSELHGNTNLEICRICNKQYFRDYDVCVEHNDIDNHLTGRKCKNGKCKGRLYDTTINFGEHLNDFIWNAAEENAKKSDFCLVLGSSLTVIPAANLPEIIGKNHKLCIVNLQKTPLDHLCDIKIYAKCDDVMELLMQKLNIKIPEWTLKRYINVNVNYKTKFISINGVDFDGTPYDILSLIKLIINNKKFIKRNKQCSNGGVFRKCLSSHNDIIKLELGFMGHYNEPYIVIELNKYIHSMKKEEFMLKLVYNPSNRQWTVSKADDENIYDVLQEEKLNNIGGTAQIFDFQLNYITDYVLNDNQQKNDKIIYCGHCTMPPEFCRYSLCDEQYKQCLVWMFNNNLTSFMNEIHDLQKRNIAIFNQIHFLCVFKKIKVIYYWLCLADKIISDDLVCLIAKYIGKLEDDSLNEKSTATKRIIVSMEKCKGNKGVKQKEKVTTSVGGLLESGLNIKEKEIKQAFKIKFASGVCCNFINGRKGEKQFIIQGDIRYDIMKFIKQKYSISPKLLFYEIEKELFNACNTKTGMVLPPYSY